MTADRYFTVSRPNRFELREKKSRFFSVISNAESDSEAQVLLARRRKKYPDASHHCWATRLGIPPVERTSDAGEPTGTAGVPMLQVLRGANLTNTLAIVTRWFGGTKLGKGGLARAYAQAVRENVRSLEIEELIPSAILDLELPLAKVGDLKRLLQPPRIEIVEEAYGTRASISVRVALAQADEFVDSLNSRQLFPKQRHIRDTD